MKKRNLFAVFILPLVTFGIYGLVWLVKTKDEMNRLGAKIPTAWLLIIPFVNYYWLWKYSEGVEQVSGGKMSTVMSFVLELFLGIIANVIIQSEFNKLADVPAAVAPADVSSAPVSQPGSDSVPSEPFVQPGAVLQTPAFNDSAADLPTETVTNDFQQPADQSQPTASASGVISDVVSQPTVAVENNSPSQPTPPSQV